MRPFRIAILLVAVAAIVALALAGCSTKKTLVPRLSPKTQLFVQFNPADGDSHTVNHVAHLYWVGSDPDGFVVGYDFRFIWPGGPTDPAWTRTTRNDSTFLVPDTTGYSTPTFQVRAVDNDGLVDPSPPSQSFSFSNSAPVVTLLTPPTLGETTFPTQTIDWRGVDPDGDANLLTYRVWLDGNESTPHHTTGNEFTFPTSDFVQGGRLRTGPRTAFVQAIDAGGRTSPVASATWLVRAPVPDSLQRPRLLVIDDIGSSDDPAGNYDRFYSTAITNSGLPANSWSIIQLGAGRPFRSSKDLEQSLKLFDAVVWYRGSARYNTTRDTLLSLHSDALGAYLDAGGKVYLEALDMIRAGSTDGLLSENFMRQYLGSDYVHKIKPFTANDSIASFTIAKEAYVDTIDGIEAHHLSILHSTLFADSLKSNTIQGGLRAFGIRDTNDVVLWARDSSLAELQNFDAPIAVRGLAPGGGRIIATSCPIPPLSGFGGSTARFIQKILNSLGIGP